MRKLLHVLGKLLLICFFFSQALFINGIRELLHTGSKDLWYQSIMNMSDVISSKTKDMDLTKELLLTNQYENSNIQQLDFDLPPYSNVEIIDTPQTPNPPAQTPSKPTQLKKLQNIKRIYIYNTHQMEEYLDQNTVMEATQYLANKLRKGGMIVDTETNDFVAYGREKGWGYNDLYKVSRYFLQKKLESNQYDLIIDFHRDSLKREQTYFTANGKNYAKLMIVIGTLSPHFDAAYYKATTLSDKINQGAVAIMKPVYKQYARYNQDFQENMMLLEVGSNQNNYEEILNSLDIFAKALLELKGE